MKQIKFALVFLLFLGVTFAQEQAITQIEISDITQIEEKAIADAKADFDKKSKLGWGGASIVATWGGILSRPILYGGTGRVFLPAVVIGFLVTPIASEAMPVNLPQKRELELSSKSSEYEVIYLDAYRSKIMSSRLKYSWGTPLASFGVIIVAGIIIEFLVTPFPTGV